MTKTDRVCRGPEVNRWKRMFAGFIQMIRSRQLAVHTYHESTDEQIIALVFSDYYPALYALLEGLDDERAKRT